MLTQIPMMLKHNVFVTQSTELPRDGPRCAGALLQSVEGKNRVSEACSYMCGQIAWHKRPDTGRRRCGQKCRFLRMPDPKLGQNADKIRPQAGRPGKFADNLGKNSKILCGQCWPFGIRPSSQLPGVLVLRALKLKLELPAEFLIELKIGRAHV